MELLSNLRKLVDKKISFCNADDFEKYNLIKNILKEDDCFFKIDKTTAYAILEDLDFLKKEIPLIYDKLIGQESYLDLNKTFEVID